MNIISNSHIRDNELVETYVILVKRGNVTKGVAKSRWLKDHIDCTVKPQSMMRFNTEQEALVFWGNHYWRDRELKLFKVVKLKINYSLENIKEDVINE